MPDERNMLTDKDPMLCWNDNEVRIRFYDAANNCAFTLDGKRDGAIWSNMIKYDGYLPPHLEKALAGLED